MDMLIVGAGIGGLAAALALHARGISCRVYEQAPEIRELGVGINVLPHAVSKLQELGLLSRLDDVAIRTDELIYTNRFGQEIWREPRGTNAGYDVPQFSIHRGRLQRVLLEAVNERIGNVHTGHRLAGFNNDFAGITAHFETSGGRVSVSADAMIAADGIHSITRKTVCLEDDPPRWNGIMIWRGAVDWRSFLTGRSMIIAGGMREKLVVYPIAQGSKPGTTLTNWSVNVQLGDKNTPLPRREDWSRLGRRDELMPHVRRFSIPYLDVKGLIEGTPEFWEYPMCDRDPLPCWVEGRVALLGDAAHPMYPVGSNGAGQAILDADMLAECLTAEKDIAAAFAKYQSVRLPLTAEVVRLNRSGGPENVIDVIENLAPDGFNKVTDVISREELAKIVNGYAAVAGFSQNQVNSGRGGQAKRQAQLSGLRDGAING